MCHPLLGRLPGAEGTVPSSSWKGLSPGVCLPFYPVQSALKVRAFVAFPETNLAHPLSDAAQLTYFLSPPAMAHVVVLCYNLAVLDPSHDLVFVTQRGNSPDRCGSRGKVVEGEEECVLPHRGRPCTNSVPLKVVVQHSCPP